jgi:hypothetical protein
VRSVGIDAGVPWEGYGPDQLAGRVAMLMRAVERQEGPLYQAAGLADAFHAAQLAALRDLTPAQRKPAHGHALRSPPVHRTPAARLPGL